MKNYGQTGIGAEVEFGKTGTKIKNEASDQMSVLQNDGIALSRMKGADPIDQQDFITKAYLERQPDLIATGNIEVNAPSAGAYNGQVKVVTKALLTAPYDGLGDLFKWNSTTSLWEAIAMSDGIRLSVDNTIVGTDFTLAEGHLYIYDINLNATYGWTDIGPSATVANLYKAVNTTFAFGDANSAVVIGTIPAGAIIDEMLIQVDTAFDGATPEFTIELATDGIIMTAPLSDAEVIGLYQADSFESSSVSQNVVINLSNSSATVGAGRVLVKYKQL